MSGKSKKETGTPTAVPPNGDDALFEALGKSRKAKKRKIIRTVLIIVAVLVAALIAGVSILQRQVRKQFASSSQEVLSAAAERGTISTVVSGSGTLTNVDSETVSVPSGVEVTETLVEFGDTVQEGDLLTTVDMASVRTAMSDLQGEIENLDDQIADADGDTVSSYVSAGVPGRVKAIYAEKGKLVEDVMVEHGGLAELSLDGCMAADIETEALSEGDRVTVVLSDGEEMGGTVEKTVGGTATVLVTDNGPENGEAVTVKSESGAELGSGTLYIHNSLTVTGYAGTVSTVDAVLNQKVYASTTLFTLKDTSTSASYDALLRERSEKEETLLKLLQIQRSNGLTAPISGSVYSVADLDDEDGEEEITDIVVLSPDVSMSVTISVDEADILALELGQEADVTVSSVSDETLSGVVTEIDKTSASGDYTAVITLDKVTGMLPGMTASVDVRIEGVDDAMLVADVGREHLVDTARWLINEPLLGIQYLDPLGESRTHPHHGKRLDLRCPHGSDPGKQPTQWKTPGAVKQASEGQSLIRHVFLLISRSTTSRKPPARPTISQWSVFPRLLSFQAFYRRRGYRLSGSRDNAGTHPNAAACLPWDSRCSRYA